MTVQIDYDSPRITFQKWGLKPSAFVIPKPKLEDETFVIHSGEGFKPPQDGKLPFQGPAWVATGSVRMIVSPGDSLSGWKFGFLQICRPNDIRVRYVGRTREDGSAVIRPLKLDGVEGRCFIDVVDMEPNDSRNANPFSEPPVTGTALRPPIITCSTGDHPIVPLPISWQNTKPSCGLNLIFKYFESMDFWTILTLQDPDDEFHYLAHFKWSFTCSVDVLSWTGRPLVPEFITHMVVTSPDPVKTAPHVESGAPRELVRFGPNRELLLDKLKLDGTDETANNALRRAFKGVAKAPPGLAVHQFDDWPSDVPNNFYTPTPGRVW